MEQRAFDQSDVFAFLADPATHGLSEPVKRIDTHGAAVFLAGKDVYKVKKAVRFPFMDFSTLDKRQHACARELAVNQANAPDLYLGTVPISREDSKLRLGSGGTIIEWAVHMRRFDENQTLDRLAERHELNSEIMARLACAVAALAPVRANYARSKFVRRAGSSDRGNARLPRSSTRHLRDANCRVASSGNAASF